MQITEAQQVTPSLRSTRSTHSKMSSSLVLLRLNLSSSVAALHLGSYSVAALKMMEAVRKVQTIRIWACHC